MATTITESSKANTKIDVGAGVTPVERKQAPLLRLGFWSAVLTAVTSTIFSVTGLMALAGIIHFPWDPAVPDGASFILALSFVVMMASIHRFSVSSSSHQSAPGSGSDDYSDRSIWSQVGLAFATMYAGLVCMVYIVTLTVVVPYTMRGEAGQVSPFVFDVNGSFMQAVDGLGYFLMCLATWFAAPVFAGPGIEKWLHRLFILNGTVGIAVLLSYMPLVIPSPYYLAMEALASIWVLSVPACAVITALYFRRAGWRLP